MSRIREATPIGTQFFYASSRCIIGEERKVAAQTSVGAKGVCRVEGGDRGGYTAACCCGTPLAPVGSLSAIAVL